MANRTLWSALATLAAAWSISAGIASQDTLLQTTFNDWLEHPAIKYGTNPTTDPVSELNRRIQAGEVSLK